MMAAFQNIVGQRFGRLLATAYAETSPNGHGRFAFLCSCGEEKVIAARSVKSGATKSCSCLRREQNALRKKVK